jgi:hypothetical protein
VPLPHRVAGLILATLATGVLTAAAPAAAHADTDPSAGQRSNLGLCSPFLASLDAPVFAGDELGGNARSGVNLLIKALGPMLPDQLDSPGELYRIRAREHPDAPAATECLPRPPV